MGLLSCHRISSVRKRISVKMMGLFGTRRCGREVHQRRVGSSDGEKTVVLVVEYTFERVVDVVKKDVVTAERKRRRLNNKFDLYYALRGVRSLCHVFRILCQQVEVNEKKTS